MTPAEIAETLDEAALKAVEVDSFGDALDVDGAYEAQRALVARRVARGEKVVGIKLGLTSVAKQRRMGVHEPIRGTLTDAMVRPGGDEPLDLTELIHPRLEPELVFLLERELAGPGCTVAHVLAATAGVGVAMDVIDSRYRDFKFSLTDVIADNASSAICTVGSRLVPPALLDLETIGVVLREDGEVVATAAGAALLGHPAASVAWAVNHLARTGESLPAGSVVLAGALTDAVAVTPGKVVEAEADGLGSVRLRGGDAA